MSVTTTPTPRWRRTAELLKKTRPFRTRPAITWAGGKSRMVDAILALIPKHECYCEPFSGGLAVLLAKERSQNEIINDVHTDLITFYRCVKFHREELLTELEFVLNSRQEFNDFRTQRGLTDIQRSARWFTRNKISFGGNMESFGVRVSHGTSSRENRMEAIRQLNLRLDTATIEHVDWEHCVKLYDRPTTFFFFDPPYTQCSKTNYEGWKDSDILHLREVIDRLQGKWLVTLNDAPSIRSIFHDCRLKAISRPRGIANKGGKSAVYKELIIAPK